MTFIPEPLKQQNELLRALRKELAAKERELANQKWVFNQFLKSPTWRFTAPIRWFANQLRSLGRSPKEATPVGEAFIEIEDLVTSPETALPSGAKSTFNSFWQASLQSFLTSGDYLVLPESKAPVVSIVLVLFNRAELTYACLRSIIDNTSVDLEVVIVDNASSDDTTLLLDRVRGARVIRNTENLHFVKAMNQAAHECRGEHLLLLNNDAQLLPCTLENALATLRSSDDIGAVGGKIILLDGRLQEAGSIVWQDGSCLGYGRGENPFEPQYMFRRDVDYCSAALLLTHRSLWEQLGGFDEAFSPAYYEETDYCMRLAERGLRVVYEPTATIMHYEFGSSESSESAIELQRRNRSIFLDRHRAELETRQVAHPEQLVRARARNRDHRVLFLDDRVPHLWQGSGFPRANAIIQALLKRKCLVTLFPSDDVDEPWESIYSDFPREVEVMKGLGRRLLEAFLRNRPSYYDTIVVSRPHNMGILNPLITAHEEWFADTHIIYDAEALFATRTISQRQLESRPMSEDEIRTTFTAEIGLTRFADTIVSVSENERQLFLKYGVSSVEVLGHSMQPTPTETSFDDRRGLLFVGAVHEDLSPNADSLIWFLTEIFPKVRAALGDVPLTIAGVNRSKRIRALAGPGVEIAGHLPSLLDLYSQSKLFIAPTRFAAGIPHKVHEAAAHGLPVIATPLLATQLGWTENELAIAGDSTGFAAHCIALYRDGKKWQCLRNSALDRVREECSPITFEQKVASMLKSNPVGSGR